MKTPLSPTFASSLVIVVCAAVGLFLFFDHHSTWKPHHQPKVELPLQSDLVSWKGQGKTLLNLNEPFGMFPKQRGMNHLVSIYSDDNSNNLFQKFKTLQQVGNATYSIQLPQPQCAAMFPGGNIFIFLDISALRSCNFTYNKHNYTSASNSSMILKNGAGFRIYNVSSTSYPFGVNGSFQISSPGVFYIELQPQTVGNPWPIYQPYLVPVLDALNCIGGFAFVINYCPTGYYCYILQYAGASCDVYVYLMPSAYIVTPTFYALQTNQDCNFFTPASFTSLLQLTYPTLNTSYLIIEPFVCGSVTVSFRCAAWTLDLANALCFTIYSTAATPGNSLNYILQVVNNWISWFPVVPVRDNSGSNTVWFAFFALFAIPVIGIIIWLCWKRDHPKSANPPKSEEPVVAQAKLTPAPILPPQPASPTRAVPPTTAPPGYFPYGYTGAPTPTPTPYQGVPSPYGGGYYPARPNYSTPLEV